MRTRLDDEEITERLRDLALWQRDGDAIVRTFTCADFPAAIAFVVHVGFLAEVKDHHPDLDIRWRKVRVLLTTHDVDGLSDLDFELAAAIDAVGPALESDVGADGNSGSDSGSGSSRSVAG